MKTFEKGMNEGQKERLLEQLQDMIFNLQVNGGEGLYEVVPRLINVVMEIIEDD